MSNEQPDEALLPCPFCGGDAFISFDGEEGNPNDWSANCHDTMNCGATVAGMFTENAARAAWNTRSHASVAAGEGVADSGDNEGVQ